MIIDWKTYVFAECWVEVDDLALSSTRTIVHIWIMSSKGRAASRAEMGLKYGRTWARWTEAELHHERLGKGRLTGRKMSPSQLDDKDSGLQSKALNERRVVSDIRATKV
jgi:hypothetical protein